MEVAFGSVKANNMSYSPSHLEYTKLENCSYIHKPYVIQFWQVYALFQPS